MRPPIANAFPRFWNAYRIFHRAFLWIWMGGIALCLLVSEMHVGRRWLEVVFVLSVLPAIVGWLGFNGIGILLNLLPQLRDLRKERQPSVWLMTGIFLILGLTFTLLAARFIWVLLRSFTR
jgi:hypothetical protein